MSSRRQKLDHLHGSSISRDSSALRRSIVGPQSRHVEARNGVMGSRLVAERDVPTVLGSQPKDTVLAALGKKVEPMGRRGRLEFRRRDILDSLADQLGDLIAKHAGDPTGHTDVDLLVVGHEPDLVGVRWHGRILIRHPRGYDLERSRSDFVG